MKKENNEVCRELMSLDFMPPTEAVHEDSSPILKKREDPGLAMLKAKKDGFYTKTGDFWFSNEFVIDYSLEHGYVLRSITKSGALGKTIFKSSEYKVTWFLKKDKSE